jgi:hypothetical protein
MPWVPTSRGSRGRSKLFALVLGLFFMCGIVGNLAEPRFSAANAISIGVFLLGLWVVVIVYRRRP